MGHFKKVRTGHKRWRAHWPALAGGATAARANWAQAWGVARSLQCGTVSSAFVLLSPLCLWCEFEKRHWASVRGTTVASSR